jgi:hypothetical protein
MGLDAGNEKPIRILLQKSLGKWPPGIRRRYRNNIKTDL